MKKKKLINLIILISMIIISVFALVPLNNHVKNDPWMSRVDDDKRIVELSIPGTHDSGATHSIFDVSGKCQDLSIKSQLNIGVRFFDIRLQLKNDKFYIVHSFVDQKLSFDKVLNELVNYIQNNKSEFLIVSLKKEADDVKSSLDFNLALKDMLYKHKDIICFDSSLPNTLKEARGKIYLLSRCDLGAGISAYHNWEDSTTFELNNMYIQDNYCIDKIDIKKEDILKTIEFSKNNNDKLVLNFTSCYLDNDFPPTYAGKAAKHINPWLEETLNTHSENLGIIITDFMSKKLSKSIYERNI